MRSTPTVAEAAPTSERCGSRVASLLLLRMMFRDQCRVSVDLATSTRVFLPSSSASVSLATTGYDPLAGQGVVGAATIDAVASRCADTPRPSNASIAHARPTACPSVQSEPETEESVKAGGRHRSVATRPSDATAVANCPVRAAFIVMNSRPEWSVGPVPNSRPSPALQALA